MSKSSGKHHRKQGSTLPGERRRTRDRSIYLGLLIIGAAIVTFVFLVTGGGGEDKIHRAIALGYLMALAYLTNLYAFKAYRGNSLANWQQALARLPLRFAGFGSKDGRPLSAAHDQAAAMKMIYISVAFSVIILVGLSFVLIPGII